LLSPNASRLTGRIRNFHPLDILHAEHTKPAFGKASFPQTPFPQNFLLFKELQKALLGTSIQILDTNDKALEKKKIKVES